MNDHIPANIKHNGTTRTIGHEFTFIASGCGDDDDGGGGRRLTIRNFSAARLMSGY